MVPLLIKHKLPKFQQTIFTKTLISKSDFFFLVKQNKKKISSPCSVNIYCEHGAVGAECVRE